MEALVQLAPLLLLVALFYVLVVRRAQKQQQEFRSVQAALAPGQEVVTTAGLYATIEAVDTDTVTLRIAPGVSCRYARPAVSRIVSPTGPAAPPPAEDGPPAGA